MIVDSWLPKRVVSADLDADAHRHSVEKIFCRLGETDTTNNVLKLLKEARAWKALQLGES